MTQLYAGLLLGGTLVLLLGVFSRSFKQRWYLTEPLTAFLIGVAAGPVGLNLLRADDWGSTDVLLTASLFTLVIADMGVALRLPSGYIRDRWRSVAIMLGPVMLLMWLTSGLLTLLILDMPLWAALLAGAIVTSTDPVVATSIISGRVAEKNIPARVRHLISAESGGNDGMAYPLVLLPILVLTLPTGDAVVQWATEVLIWSIGGAIVLGVGLGYLAGRLIRWAVAHEVTDPGTFLAYTVALSLLTLGASQLLRVDAVLAVFAAGIAYRMVKRGGGRDEEQKIQLALSQFFVLPMFVLIGMTIPWQEWGDLGWAGAAAAVAIVLLRRLPALWLLHRTVAEFEARKDWLFTGWFGPIGVSTVFYAMLALQREVPGADEIWALASMTVVASLVVHGLTATPFARRYAATAPVTARQGDEPTHDEPGQDPSPPTRHARHTREEP